MTFVQTADVVIVGGGVIDTSVAFYLARMGAGQVVLLERFCARFPGMEAAGVRRGYAGVYVNTEDECPLVGPAPGVEGFYLITGFSGKGFKMAPAIGLAMAELILNGHAETVNITPLRVTRFEEGEPVERLHPYVF